MFCARTLISESFRPSSVAASAVNGAHSATSTPLPSGSFASSFCPNARASAGVLNTFQLPAMEGRLGIVERPHAGQRLALEQLERGAAAGRQVRRLLGEPERGERRRRVAAA